MKLWIVKRKTALCLFSLAFLSLFIRLYVTKFLALSTFSKETLLLTDLLGHGLSVPGWLILGFGVGNLILIFFVGRELFTSQTALLAALLYAISPWTIYSEVSGSIYILLAFLLLLLFWSKVLAKKNEQFVFLSVAVSVVAIYSNVLMWLIIPTTLWALGLRKKDLKSGPFLLVILFVTPLLFLVMKNPQAIRNIFFSQLALFSNVGLVNAVNTFRGELLGTPYYKIGKLVENRYFYLSEHFFLNFLNHLSPVTYFTPQFKLLGFSFSPPIFVGWLVPFFYGLKKTRRYLNKERLAVLFVLLLPSILSRESPDLTKAVLLSPILFLAIAAGVVRLYKSQSFILRLLLLVSVCLVLFQGLVTMADISNREPVRLMKMSQGL